MTVAGRPTTPANESDAKEQSVLRSPVFVIGVFRSGTSLLYSLLNQHPQIALMYESDFWNFPEFFSPMRFRRNWLERQEFYNQTLSRHRLIYGGSLRGLEGRQTPKEIYRVFSDGKGAAVCGEKSPFYCTRLKQVARRHPESLFILIWRNPVEIYRSTIDAGRKVPYFRQPGMLSRLIHYNEEMIRQSKELEQSGVRIHHVRYDDLVDKTEAVCRGICQFLGIEFTPQMLELHNADFSAVYRAENFNHLRRGVVERRQSTTVIPPGAWKKLQRYGVRWNRLVPDYFKNESVGGGPSSLERFGDKISGHFWHLFDDAKRVVFEFIPLPWLRMYRQIKKWYLARHSDTAAESGSLAKQFRANWITILASAALLAGVAAIDFFSGPVMTFAPFYLVPVALMTLIVGRRWGTFAAILSATVWSAVQAQHLTDFQPGPMAWNCVMRFVFLEIVVLLLYRVRLESTTVGDNA
ncbi:MAG TPA: sulfotransferase [Verrucomicrobiae bacterium]|nr:sulfotransferase [Verrucomicrobiae bacterium]